MIYSLGGSFANWHWPTWVDWFAKYKNEKLINLAYPGHSNLYVYYKLLEIQPKLTPDDEVCVTWSGAHRYSCWVDNEWVEKHQCHSFFQNSNGKLWFSKDADYCGLYKTHPDYMPSLTDMLIGTFSSILNTQLILDKIGCKYTMAFSQNPWMDGRDIHVPSYRLTCFDKQSLSDNDISHARKIIKFPTIKSLLMNINWSSFGMIDFDCENPLIYDNIWDSLFSDKEYILEQHESDKHPNTVVHHDWAIKKFLKIEGKYKLSAKKISLDSQNMCVPPWKECMDESPILLNQYNIEDYC